MGGNKVDPKQMLHSDLDLHCLLGPFHRRSAHYALA